MEKKKYSSYAEIDRDLEILKLEKDINYQKLVLSFQKTKESITTQNIVNGFVSSYTDYFSNSYTSILQSILPYVIGWFINKKRGS
ncbi:DUF6327 family protein [Flavobacterium johnsoniae]|uniref:Uncharacterized protein n=1 Tax=Flavobacterium johnsoniae (strain ATCC 17061 / DSM 2064 / JCM 8514 / BCRC 14874 / CCUG 350202 / NBRC 14942 / NCIMB 11054 / UW101) TaxID=376686 RepID=A5FL75_FLAJ1|nr:DUF6327 family protein [Flavobacterium johnsoniae]ABQ04041.1 hypothetical protein Fjoh_1008 [Flavobacterium johnsoniae UW101]OXE95418.1 hypothetical protein B0A63_24375 [Flavobacterium johnsoniae UW101]WQG79088.1 DUF6327 family protein [Flavobacterium johnsoniae UW101]SHK10664.1 hypothetical protein SAMN05444146_0419 [Flavobacterium johnsoniae]